MSLPLRQTSEFQIRRQDFPVEVFEVPLRTRIEGGRDADNHAIIEEIQMEVVRNGLIINAILFNAQIWFPRAQPTTVPNSANGDARRRPVERQPGAVCALALTIVGIVQVNGFLAQATAGNNVRGKKQRVRITRSTREVWRRLGWIFYGEQRKLRMRILQRRQCEQSKRLMISDSSWPPGRRLKDLEEDRNERET